MLQWKMVLNLSVSLLDLPRLKLGYVKVCLNFVPSSELYFHLCLAYCFLLIQVFPFQAMKYQDFYCKNCEYQQHQCYACGELGSSDQSSHAEVRTNLQDLLE